MKKVIVGKPSFDRQWLPEPILDSDPELVEFYWKAWEMAWDHIKGCDGVPASPFMDEAFSPRTIWIWDTCFMALFCKYAPERFPGIESLENFYQPMHQGSPSALRIHHPDNPPLFAWVEREYQRFRPDKERIKRLVADPGLLIQHFDFIENAEPDVTPGYANCPLKVRREDYGYRWNGVQSGMDNTPRGGDAHDSIYWVDLIAQQALAADCISELAEAIGESATARKYRQHYQKLKDIINRMYWDESDDFYYDIAAITPNEKVRVKTPASFWPMLAGCCDDGRAKSMARHAAESFGGEIPWPSVSRDHREFNPRGAYWRGSVWLPTAYMATKALERHGLHVQAAAMSKALLVHMWNTYANFSPHTIWECYSPTAAKPGTNGDGKLSRPDFCGWSALGPISMLIENVIGIQEADATIRRVVWNKTFKGRMGIKRLKFGDITTDLLSHDDKITVSSNSPYILSFNGGDYKVMTGINKFEENSSAGQ